MRMRSGIQVVLDAALFAMIAAVPAHAATGTYEYMDIRHNNSVVTDPITGQCYSTPDSADEHNNTDMTAHLFYGPECTDRGDGVIVPPGWSDTSGSGPFQSVLFY